MWRGRAWRLVLLVGALAAPAGCDSGDPAAVPVRGTVLFRSEPLAGGTIVFTPDAERGGSGPLAHARIRPDGGYELSQPGAGGLAPGWYRVTIAPPPRPAGAAASPPPALPPKYRHPDHSGLLREVLPGGPNVFDFRLPAE
ncbi:MAG TPA: hypothetical protein VIL46_02840 [Gemmataceae bacterium]